MSADIRVIYESNFRDPVKTLRVIADQIEAGKFGDVMQVAIVVLGDTCEIFATGVEASACETAILLQAGAHRMIEAVAKQGRE